MKVNQEALQNFERLKKNNSDMLIVFQVGRGTGRFRDRRGRFTHAPRFIARFEGMFGEADNLTIRANIITQVGGTRKPVDELDLHGSFTLAANQLVDVYPAGHFYSPRRTE